MHTRNRRDFLKLAASVSVAAAVGKATSLYADSQGVPGAVRAWRTTPYEKFQAMQSPPQWEPWTGVSALGIHLEPGRQYQEMIGFGGAFTDASCYILHQMAPDARHALLSDLYGPAGLRLSVGRTCMGASDFSTKLYRDRKSTRLNSSH